MDITVRRMEVGYVYLILHEEGFTIDCAYCIRKNKAVPLRKRTLHTIQYHLGNYYIFQAVSSGEIHAKSNEQGHWIKYSREVIDTALLLSSFVALHFTLAGRHSGLVKDHD